MKVSEKEKNSSPLIIQRHQLIQAAIRSDDENSFYFDCLEGCLLYEDLSKSDEQLAIFHERILGDPVRFQRIPVLALYEKKKIIEGYLEIAKLDDDTKAKIPEFLQSATAPEVFWDYIKDNIAEVEIWTQYYNQRMTVWSIKLLRNYNVLFTFEEDLMQDFTHDVIERYKQNMFTPSKGDAEVKRLRAIVVAKAAAYYNKEALIHRPRRGRPPKAKDEALQEKIYSTSYYTQIPVQLQPFIFRPLINTFSPVLFPSTHEQLSSFGASLRGVPLLSADSNLSKLSARLSAIQKIGQPSASPLAGKMALFTAPAIKVTASPVGDEATVKKPFLGGILKGAFGEKAPKDGSTSTSKVSVLKGKKK